VKLAATIARSLQAGLQADLRDIERAVATGTRDVGRGLKTELRRQVASAGLGQRLANSWRDRHYPNRKLDAASLVYTKAPQIIRAFGEGAVIRSRRGRFLAIPTENAPRKGTDGKRISPSTFPEHRFGPLRLVPRPSGPSLLVVDGLRASFRRKSGELRGFRRAPENIAAVMELYPVGERFFQEFTLRQVLLNAAKNACGPSAAGTSSRVEGPNIAEPAATTASPAPEANPERTGGSAPTASTP
jgi:hypothetical protein